MARYQRGPYYAPRRKKGEEGYEEYRAAYNARRRARFADPEYRAKQREDKRRRAQERADEKD